MRTNAQIAADLATIAQLMDLLGEDSFRSSANARASRSIESLTAELSTLAGDRAALLKIEGVGPKIADKIIEACTTGRIGELEELRAKVPPGLLPLLNVPGLGPKTVRMFWQQAGVTDLAGLRRIIADGSILALPRMGAKAVEKIKGSLALAAEGGGRLPLGPAAMVARAMVERMRRVKGVAQAEFAGSLRRGRDTIGDVDILVATDDPEAAVRAFTSAPGVVAVLAAGETRSSVRIALGGAASPEAPSAEERDEPAPAAAPHDGPSVQVDLKVVPAESWGAALMYFTGSKDHNVALRQRALDMGYTLNEYGLFPLTDHEKAGGAEPLPPHKRGARPVAAADETAVYKALGLPYIPPELRENRGELALKTTPRLVELDDIKAELHAHTTASDGVLSIEDLARRARQRGFHTIAVTDHSQSSAIANGLKPARLREHIKAVHAARESVKGITILAGSEVDIKADGSLDYADDLLACLDIVVASPHASLSQDPDTATRRLLRAVEHPLVHILGHPTGRLVLKRPGLSPDMAALFAAAKSHDVALEINAHWMRLDLRDVHVHGAVEAGCLLAIDCDVHHPDDFDNLCFGVTTARRGWLTPDRCINCWPADRLHAWLRNKRKNLNTDRHG
ncbi:MAG: PHP domain-containing protein [Phycisphaeraceae bacterium]|nr:PHP domain-containing protein [Phycisphaeraceae bacterium]